MSHSELFDDIWGSSPEDNDFVHRDTNKLREQHCKRGYLDGIVSSKESNLQKGFDDGFPHGANLGKEVGLIIGRLQCLNYLYGENDHDLAQSFEDAQMELKINHVLNKSAFDENYDLINGSHELIEKWKSITKKYCDQYNVSYL